MDTALAELEPNSIPAIHDIWRSVKITALNRGANAAPPSPGGRAKQ